jgi:hypothetical protein
MEGTDWASVVAGGLAITILIGGMLMMFTTLWTSKSRKGQGK